MQEVTCEVVRVETRVVVVPAAPRPGTPTPTPTVAVEPTATVAPEPAAAPTMNFGLLWRPQWDTLATE
ncbi:MAG: hypothetical protein ACUVWS_18475, partial [Roseiflexus sp.]